jgi:peptide chain release factor subunit 3
MAFNPNAMAFNPNAGAFTPSWMNSEPAAEPAPAADETPAPEPAAAEEDSVEAVSDDVVGLVLTGADPVPEKPEAPEEPAAPAESKTMAEIEAEQLAEIAELEAAEAEAAAAEAAAAAAAAAPAAAPKQSKKEKGPKNNTAAAPAEVDASTLNKKKLVNVIFIGHVDAGKSTLSGHLMYLTGMLDDRTLAKFESEAKSKNRESWKFAWALDVTDVEREKGKTEECGRAAFETEDKRFIIIDAPGHKSFVPHMIGGAAQADVAVLVISARRGEFETGFEKGGQTREHAMLAKTAGVKRLCVVINKMDDPTVEWSKDRYDECVTKLTPYLKSVGFNLKEVQWMPISGLGGANLKDGIPDNLAPWYEGPPLLTYLNNVRAPKRLLQKPMRLPVNGAYREMGVILVGKVEAGMIYQGQKYILFPNKQTIEIVEIAIETDEGLTQAECGDNCRLKVKGAEDSDLQSGFVLCDPLYPIKMTKQFLGKVVIMESKNIICAGYSCIMHIHSLVVEVTFGDLLAIENQKTKKITKKKPAFVRASEKEMVIIRMTTEASICVEEFSEYAQLGRFMLRDEGQTIGIGLITKIKED